MQHSDLPAIKGPESAFAIFDAIEIIDIAWLT